MANLLLLTGPEQGKRLPLSEERISLGRDPKCGIVITERMVQSEFPVDDSNSISRKHALISCEGDKYFIEDGDGHGHRSRNGVFVNDKKVPFPDRIQLRHNDRIRLCKLVCVFQDVDSTFSLEEAISHRISLQSQSADRLRIVLEISNSLSRALEID